MAQQVFRIDKFIVPESSKHEFMQQVHRTHELLRTLPGFIEDSLVEKIGGPAEFSIVTIVIWEDHSAIENAKIAVHKDQSGRNFNPKELWDKLGIKADLGNYSRIDA